MSSLPRAILFDHDGVLVASEPLHWSAWRQLISELGIPYHENEIRVRVGKPAPLILKELLDIHCPGWHPGDYDLNTLALRKNDYYLNLAQTHLQLYPGVREGLEWLKVHEINTAVVSNAKRRELAAALQKLSILDLLDQVVSRDDVETAKPDPTPYIFAAGALNTPLAECIAVEDSPTGIESALFARVPSAAILTNFSQEAMETPVPGRPDLKPKWLFESTQCFFDWLRTKHP
jgi:HAD superfamily hydrolase (TIGR01509 family)